MSLLSVDTLTTPLTEDQVVDKLLDILETLSIPARSWRTGGTFRTILRAVARTYSDFNTLLAAALKGGFLESASGDWLTLLARNVYGVERTPATFAAGQLTLTNTGGGLYSISATTLRALNPTTGKAYTNVADFTLNPGTSLTIDITAVEQGAASSTGPGTITELETTLLGVTITNPQAVAGNDAETDDELRQHCKDKLGALSVRGPRTAYAYAVKQAVRTDGSPVNVNRFAVSSASSTGTVDVFLASASGTPDSEDISGVETAIDTYARPECVTVTVTAATSVPIAKTLTVYAKNVPGVSSSTLLANITTALTTAIASYPVGGIPIVVGGQGYFYADWLGGVIKAVDTSIYHVDGLGSDVALGAGEVATLSATITVRIVDVP